MTEACAGSLFHGFSNVCGWTLIKSWWLLGRWWSDGRRGMRGAAYCYRGPPHPAVLSVFTVCINYSNKYNSVSYLLVLDRWPFHDYSKTLPELHCSIVQASYLTTLLMKDWFLSCFRRSIAALIIRLSDWEHGIASQFCGGPAILSSESRGTKTLHQRWGRKTAPWTMPSREGKPPLSALLRWSTGLCSRNERLCLVWGFWPRFSP